MTAAADRAAPALCHAEARVVLGQVGFDEGAATELGSTVFPATS